MQAIEAIAALAAAIWILVAVLKRIPALVKIDAQLIALVLVVILGPIAIWQGYIAGNPVELGIQLVVALFGANLAHDKITAPLLASAAGKSRTPVYYATLAELEAAAVPAKRPVETKGPGVPGSKRTRGQSGKGKATPIDKSKSAG